MKITRKQLERLAQTMFIHLNAMAYMKQIEGTALHALLKRNEGVAK